MAMTASVVCHEFVGGSLLLLWGSEQLQCSHARIGLLSSRYDAAVCQCCSCTLLMFLIQ